MKKSVVTTRARVVVQPPDGGIVGGVQPNQQVGVIAGFEEFCDGAQNLRQRFRVELGRSTRAAGQAGQADLPSEGAGAQLFMRFYQCLPQSRAAGCPDLGRFDRVYCPADRSTMLGRGRIKGSYSARASPGYSGELGDVLVRQQFGLILSAPAISSATWLLPRPR